MLERVLWLVDEYVMKSGPIEGPVQVIERAKLAKKEDYKPCRGRLVAFKKTSSGRPTRTVPRNGFFPVARVGELVPKACLFSQLRHPPRKSQKV